MPLSPEINSPIPERERKERLPNGRIDYRRVLNPAQYEAVAFGKGPLLVIAGAGSGKTRTLTYRVARLVEEGVTPNTILLLSFTRKASQEMLRRASLLLDRRCQEVAGGTFHSFANSLLRRHASRIGFPQGFSIIDRADSEDLINLVRKDFGSSDEGHSLPRKATLASLFSRAVNKNATLEDIIYDEYPHFGSQKEVIHQICQLYRTRKLEHHFLDYDDLLVFLHRLLSEHEDVREQLALHYEYIMVDEYQDTNRIQADIVSLLATPRNNVMVVGDDAQSIYAFRGANFKNIIEFPNRFPGTRIIKLEENYRSLQPILDVSNALIAPAAEKYSKCLFTRRGGGNLPALVATAGEHAQSRFIVREIAQLRSQGLPLKHMAILFRASFHSFDLELELSRAGFPFIKVGGFKFSESAHIKDVIAHMKIMAAPRDRLSWYRVLLLVNKIGPQSAQRIFEAVLAEGKGAIGLGTARLKSKGNPALDRLKALIAAMDAEPLDAVAQQGMLVLKYYLPILQEQYDDHPRRARDIEQLITIMERYAHLDDFLADMALEPPNTAIGEELVANVIEEDRLTLSTIHSAKGLEWDTVFIIWALDGRFPSFQSLEKPDALEEERRLLYVAATRAQHHLFITYPQEIYDRATQSVLYEPSRFLESVPADLMDCRFFDPRNAR
jgi:DNA helicase-2/ATP-dependent DNA helicase PcrA